MITWRGVAEVVLHTSERATQTILVGERAAVTEILAARDVRVHDFSVVHDPTPRYDAATSARDEQSTRDASSHTGEGGQGDPRQPARAPADTATTVHPLPARAASWSPVADSRLDLRV